MGTRKNKEWIDEEDLLKSLDELEKAAADEDESSEQSEASEASEPVKKGGKGKPPKGTGDEQSDMPDDQSDADGGFNEDDGSEMDSNDADENSEPLKKTKKSTRKSMGDRVQRNDDLKKSLEVSSFLEGLVEVTTDSVDSLAKSLDNLEGSIHDQLSRQAHALKLIGRAVIDMQKSMGALSEPDENAPVSRPRSNLNKSAFIERFDNSNEAPEFSAKQTMDVMIDLASNGKIPPVAVSAYEATGHIEPQFTSIVEQQLRKSFGGR